ncbi:hypothetical protein [Metabacillus malikii]|uniref:Uncharacterized protein n=1 Tax=Metabacillus malikii TaxID=1504265 RepID=A0ABT9ZLT7_9BACI|nr:hypothetical protein [Metabacillus malikii]MDQ0232746.1 hypothetical protein [Metabacillus malikii]
MKCFVELPKNIKKTVRYLYQDAPLDKLLEIRKILNDVIDKRLSEQKIRHD